MRYVLFSMMFCFFSIIVFGQTAIEIKEKNYTGYIFPKEYCWEGLIFNDMLSRYTPSKHDIKKSEIILMSKIDRVINKKYNIKRRNLKKYTRQYFGFINEKGNIVIYTRSAFGK